MPDTWVTPRIWITGERVGQSKMNEISNNLRVLYPYTTSADISYLSSSGAYLERLAHPVVAGRILRTTSTIMEWGSYIAGKALRTTNQNIADVTVTNVQFSGTEFSQGVTWSAGSNTRLTIGSMAGLYLVGAKYAIDGGSGYRQANILKNGNPLIESRYDNAANETTYITLMDVVSLAAADYLQLAIMHNNGSAINLRTAALYAIFLGS